MNTETLHAIDTIYLENFLQTLLYNAIDVGCTLGEALRQAETLSGTEYLSPDCRSRYEKIAKRLAPLVSELKEIMDDLYVGGKLASEYEPLVQWGLIESIPEHETRAVLERLNLAERELIASLNCIGASLLSTPEANVFWSSQARVKANLKLKPIPGRPCYQDKSMIRFCASPPWQGVHFFAELPAEEIPRCSLDPWLLDSGFVPLTELPLFEDIEIELEIHGDVIGASSNEINRRPHVGKLS